MILQIRKSAPLILILKNLVAFYVNSFTKKYEDLGSLIDSYILDINYADAEYPEDMPFEIPQKRRRPKLDLSKA